MDNLELKNKLRFIVSLLFFLLVFNLVPLNQINAVSDVKYEFENLKDPVDFKEAILESWTETELLVRVEENLLKEVDKEADDSFIIKDDREFEFNSVLEKKNFKMDFVVDY